MKRNGVLALLYFVIIPPAWAFASAQLLAQRRWRLRSAEVDSDVIIVGGGLVGMATGVALVERGVSSIQIYEQAQQLRKVGAAIGLYPNGLAALGYISPSILGIVSTEIPVLSKPSM